MLKTSDHYSITIKTVHPFSGRVTEVDVVATHGEERVIITVADLDRDESVMSSVSIEDARVIHAHLGRLIKRADRNARGIALGDALIATAHAQQAEAEAAC